MGGTVEQLNGNIWQLWPLILAEDYANGIKETSKIKDLLKKN